jgi:hypothetical protein
MLEKGPPALEIGMRKRVIYWTVQYFLKEFGSSESE